MPGRASSGMADIAPCGPLVTTTERNWFFSFRKASSAVLAPDTAHASVSLQKKSRRAPALREASPNT
jgi:hypothetical protein